MRREHVSTGNIKTALYACSGHGKGVNLGVSKLDLRCLKSVERRCFFIKSPKKIQTEGLENKKLRYKVADKTMIGLHYLL